jgi:hypothetical protein
MRHSAGGHPSRPVLVAADFAAMGISLSGALYFVHQTGAAPGLLGRLVANVILSLPLVPSG